MKIKLLLPFLFLVPTMNILHPAAVGRGYTAPMHYNEFRERLLKGVSSRTYAYTQTEKAIDYIYYEAQLTNEKFLDFIATVDALAGFDTSNKHWIIRCLGKILPENYQILIKITNILENPNEKSHFISDAAKYFGMHLTPDFGDRVEELILRFPLQMKKNIKLLCAVEALSQPKKYPPDLVEKFLKLLTGKEPLFFGISRFLSLLGEQWQYNQALREKLTQKCINVVNALSEVLNADEKIHLIRAIAEIDESKLTEEFATAISTIAVEMTFQQKIELIKAMKDVTIENYGNILLAINQLSTEFPGAVKAEGKVRVVAIIGKIIPTNYENFMVAVNGLSTGMSLRDKLDVMSNVSTILPEDYELFTSATKRLAEGEYPGQRAMIIAALAEIDPIKLTEAFITTVNRLSAGINGKEPIIRIISRIDPSQLTEAFINTVNSLSVGMDDKREVIRAVARIDSADYGTALTLGTQIQSLVHRRAAIDRFSQLSPEERVLRAARALLFVRWVANEREKGQRIIQVLETELNAEVPPIGAEIAAGANPYAAGVNVHAGDRDKKTERAYNLLLTLWNPTPEEIERDSAALTSYVKASGNAKAIRALTGEGRTTHDFGGLLQAENERVKTRLAHLWHFATISVKKDIAPGEVELAKQSIVSALADAVEGDHLVCNPGKYQRLATSVLQGRLQGVQIDTTPIPTSARLVPVTPEALEQFAPQQPAAVAAPVPERVRAIRNLDAIEEYLKPLTDGWMRIRPANDTALLQQVFDYIHNLANGQVPGTDGQHIVLDPRDVVFHLIFGKGVTREGGMLDPDSTSTLIELNVADYIAQYQEREQQAYADAKAEAERRALMATQDARFAQVKAMDLAKQDAEAVAERIKIEAAAKMAEERAAASAQRNLAAGDAAAGDFSTREDFRNSWNLRAQQLKAAPGRVEEDFTAAAAAAPAPAPAGAAGIRNNDAPAAAEVPPLTPDQQRRVQLAAMQRRGLGGYEESKSQ